jgi:PAS domain S-box-containing protein
MKSPIDRSPHPRDPRVPGWNVRVACGLFLGWLLLSHAGPVLELTAGVRAWYPPAALLAAVCMVWGARALVPIIGAASVEIVLLPATSAPLWRVLLVSAGLKAIYWIAARALRRRSFDLTFSTPGDVTHFALVFIAAGAAAALFNTVADFGIAGLPRTEALLSFRTFWIGDVVAVIAFAPALIVGAQWLARGGGSSPRISPERWLLSRPVGALLQLLAIPLALLLSTALASTVGFFSFAICFLPLGWIALTRGARMAAFANVLLTVGAMWLVHGSGVASPKRLEIQAFVGLLTLTGLLVGSVADERERAFALLGDSEERYRRLVELLPDPLLVHAGGRVLFANGAAATVLGARDAAALVGTSLAELAAPRSREVIEERVRVLGEGRGVPLTHHTMNRLDGAGTVDVESVSIPFTYQGQNAALTVARNVTTRVRLEEDLRHAQRMEAVGRLAGGVAHDFNNLLTVILSYSELVMAQVAHDPVLSSDIGEIRQAADRAASLTRQLLSFSRRQVLQPAPLELNDVVRGAEAMLRRLIGPEIEIVARLDPAVGKVFADQGQLEQVIMNLVVNARDAMPEGGTLTVETGIVDAAAAPPAARAASGADRFAMILVRDTGKGMDAETMRRIFDPFFTTKEVGQGTGLGLATVHGIIQQSGGAVAVDSEVGTGSEFRILLPALACDVAAPACAAGELTAGPTPQGCGRVLLVEDEAAVREGVRRMLGASGFDVVEARDGAAALGALDTHGGSFELVLSDVAMPVVDGRQLAREVRARWPSLPIVLMSGFADPEGLARDVPGITLLQKPLKAAALAAAIRTAVRR